MGVMAAIPGLTVICGYYRPAAAVAKPSGAAKGKRFFGTGLYNMPGAMMTKAGKRRQMQMDNNRASPRRGKRR